ncbi:hypothetical protein WN55_00355 [Dufourea novaeangliae]|uniref:39S ribosomal protein L37, mitochondrial n=1 Tax=Dufourea novaeangliae TaxID=178035 RepID=A0A154PFG4_DUFNO|nr:hypothetical protein WN55_00355 [Dufourea novaeangliae]
MKFTQVLHKHHLGRAIRMMWQTGRTRPVPVTNAEEILVSQGFKVEDALEVIKPPKPFPRVDVPSIEHVDPDWKERNCLIYKEHHLLHGGTSQALQLTKTLKIDDEIPSRVKDLIADIPEHIDDIVQRNVYTSTIYDAQQVKLPKLKDPNRPSWVFPRQYGITSTRKMHNITKKFLQLCESLCGLNIAQNRSMVHDGILSMCIDKELDVINFSLKMDLIMTSLMPLTPIVDARANSELEIPDIHPLHCTVGIVQTNSYKNEDIYPIVTNSVMKNIHTIFINNNPEEVKNITELPVFEDQIHARSLIESFTAAGTYARQRFGLDVKELPEPVVVQWDKKFLVVSTNIKTV